MKLEYFLTPYTKINKWSLIKLKSKRDTNIKNKLVDSVGEDEGGMI